MGMFVQHRGSAAAAASSSSIVNKIL